MSPTTITREKESKTTIKESNFLRLSNFFTICTPRTSGSFLDIEKKSSSSDKHISEFIEKYKETFDSLADK